MSTDKENTIFKIGILIFILMVLGSLLVSFNIYDALYVSFAFLIIIRYIIISHKK